MHIPNALRFAALVALLAACSPTSVGGLNPHPDAATSDMGAGPDAVAPADAPDDAGAGVSLCTSDRDCSELGQVCNLDRGRCVGCNTQSDCAGALVCLGHACRSVTRCTSSVMCPRQVCSVGLGFCVDCDSDRDCPAAQQCTDSACVDRPATCSSDRDCSEMHMVCNTTLAHCVACNADADCPTGRYCNGSHACSVQTCVPGQTTCQDDSHQSTCDARGAAATASACAAGQSCRDGRCREPNCTPGAATCDSATARRVCNATGEGTTTAACPSAAHASGTCAGAGVCGFACNAGYGDCDGDAANGCETSLDRPAHCGGCGTACSAGVACTAGVCSGTTCPAGMALVPSGVFMMGSTVRSEEGPVHAVQVSAFCMDLTEVTAGAYAACTTPGCTAPNRGDGCNWQSGRNNYPINCIEWASSRAYCQWRGGDLPTEAQWEYAARGTDGRTWPWGNTAPGSQLCWNRGGSCAVGSFPAGNSPFGLSDMAGNVYEWTLDWYVAGYGVGGASPAVDPVGPSSGDGRVYRGGAWYFTDPNLVRTNWRYSVVASWRGGDAGFRCAHPIP